MIGYKFEPLREPWKMMRGAFLGEVRIWVSFGSGVLTGRGDSFGPRADGSSPDGVIPSPTALSCLLILFDSGRT